MLANKTPRTAHLAAIAAALLLPAGLFGQAAPASLTVDQAVSAALANNLGVRSAAVESRIKKRASDFSFNRFLPSVSISATAIGLNNINPVLVGMGQDPVTQAVKNIYSFTPSKANIALGLGIQEVFSPVFLALMDQAAIDYQKSAITAAQAGRSVEAAVKKFFYQILVQDEAIRLTGSRLDSARERLRQTRISYELGGASELNYSYATMIVEGLVPDLRSMQSARAAALTAFQELLGFEANADMRLEGSLDGDTVAAGDPGLNESGRFDLKMSRQVEKQLESALKAQSYALLPNLILGFKADPMINGPETKSIFETKNWAQSTGALSLTVSWSLDAFLPGSTVRVGKAELEDRLALARQGEAQTLRTAHDEVVNQARAVKDSVDRIGNLTKVADASKRAYELTSAAYQLGAGRFLDMQDAEVALQGTRIQILNERLHLASLVYDFEAKYEGAAAAAN